MDFKVQIKQPDNLEPLKKDFKQIHDEHFVDIEEVLKPQPVAISIGETFYKGTYYPVSFGSYGDFSCIVGASKSKKTFLKSLITACYIGGNSNTYADNIKGHYAHDRYVIDIDTEQSHYHSQRVFRRVIEMVGANTSYYIPFALRKLSPSERLEFIEWVFTESPYKGKIGLVLIDGVADLVSDVNDLEASNNITNSLMRWSEKEQCHIITILHRNFGSAKPTGHLGSSVLKKAESVVFVEKEGDYVKVIPEYTRNQPFDPFCFRVNENWLPEVVENENLNYSITDVSNKNTNAKF